MIKAIRVRMCLVWVRTFALVAILLLSCAAFAADDGFVVRTTGGQLRGVARSGGGAEFLGIPFAEPPIGNLRWHEPVPFKPWSGVRDAGAFGAPCSQPDLGEWNHHDALRGKEDCLFLNVIVPTWPISKPLPVMFWIHGGANEGGTASNELYKNGTLVNHGVVLVTINYRLGIFGFLAHPELTRESGRGASGNYGLMDQILALRWVRQNIASFGGDPANITIFGQSAGAMDASMLMTSVEARGLFQKAIAESGAAFSRQLPSLDESERAGAQLAQMLKAPADGTIKYLRDLSAPDLLAALGTLDRASRPWIGPNVDGYVLRRRPAAVFASGQEAPVPFMYGVTTREFGSKASADELRATIRTAAGGPADKALAAYGLANGTTPADDAKYGTVSDQWTADVVFRCPAVAQGEWHFAAHNATYQYEFNHAIPGKEWAIHSSELPYVFGYFPTSGYTIAGSYGELDQKISNLIEAYFTNFARTGNPNSTGLPDWPQIGEGDTYIQFEQNGAVRTASGLRSAQCGVYREWLTARLNSAATAAASH